ncbi:hypothetical protein ScalyP_jg10133 [Parmales sp. scaly parma]|nr:hypothetical protein ScalyP_jg10133 [Parmales sp. scaly parma]
MPVKSEMNLIIIRFKQEIETESTGPKGNHQIKSLRMTLIIMNATISVPRTSITKLEPPISFNIATTKHLVRSWLKLSNNMQTRIIKCGTPINGTKP